MRLIVVSNRLPLTIRRTETGFEYRQTSGGLVTGLKALKRDMDFLWLGNISGLDLTDADRQTITADCWAQFKSIPVFVAKELNDDSYSGFCNKILWPLLHALTDDVVWSPAKFAAYRAYNAVFCERVCEVAEDGDVVWVHDYHLLLLPQMVRQQCPRRVRVGFFLHTPFPPAEAFAALPAARELLRGVLGSDGVGFHLLEYAANFLDACKKTLRLRDFADDAPPTPPGSAASAAGTAGTATPPNTRVGAAQARVPGIARRGIVYAPDAITVGARTIRVRATPIGIDAQLFRDALAQPSAQARVAELRAKFRGKKIVLGVDRTDYIKGLPHRVAAFDAYLRKYGADAVFLQVAVPSRMEVTEYRALVDRVKLLVADLNGRHGNVDDTHFFFLNNSVAFGELCALYAASDVCVVTSLRDGMNLVALEYVACQEAAHGRLVLSKFAGASSTLPGCVSVNPWDTDGVADAIRECVAMPRAEVDERHAINKRGVETFTALRWAEENVAMLTQGG